ARGASGWRSAWSSCASPVTSSATIWPPVAGRFSRTVPSTGSRPAPMAGSPASSWRALPCAIPGPPTACCAPTPAAIGRYRISLPSRCSRCRPRRLVISCPSTQSPEVQNFLLKSAVLDRFCAGLCDHVLEIRQSRRLLEEVAGAGLFLVALDDERQWYRYHPLFRDFLLRRLEEGGFEGQAALRLRAADWFREKEQLVEAIEAALAAGHPGRAAEILETCSQDWTYKGRIRLVTQFVERIPLPELQQYPTILLTWAWHLMRHLRFEEAQDLLSSVRRRVEDWENISTIPAVDLDQLRHQLLHREMTLAAARDDVLEVERKCQELLALSSQDLHPYLAGSVYAQLLHA